jgi:flagellar export protein FliJ
LFEHALRSELEVLGQRQQTLESLVSEQQAALVEAQRQVRVLEKLRERQQQHYDAVRQAVESRMLDEAGARLPRQIG